MRWIIILWMFCVAIFSTTMPFIVYNKLHATTELFREAATSVSETESRLEEKSSSYSNLLQSVSWFENLARSPFLIAQYVFIFMLGIFNFIGGFGLLLRKKWSVKVSLIILTVSIFWQISMSLEKEIYYRPLMATHITTIYHSLEILGNRQIPMKPELLKAFKLDVMGLSALVTVHCLGIAVLWILFYNRNSVLQKKAIINFS